MVPKILTFGAGQNGKKLVFGSNFVTYGAPFYKWCRFTDGAVTHVHFLAFCYRIVYDTVNSVKKSKI